LSLSPTSRIAIAYGNEIVLSEVIYNPPCLEDNREYLPRPPASPLGANKSGGPVARSLHFTRKKNHLVVTYATHGIVYAPAASFRTVLIGDSSIWDIQTFNIVGEIVPRTFPMYVRRVWRSRSYINFTDHSGKSVVATDDNTMAVSNLMNGVDWYSLTDLSFLSTTKLPAETVFYPLSGLTYSEDGHSVVLGSADGNAYILDRDRGIKNLEHSGTNSHPCEGCFD
jgi:hypothetical protein